MFRRRPVLVRLFFALLLVFAQQQAISHELAHDFERIHAPTKDTTGTHDAFCAKCLATAHLDHADGVAAAVHLPLAPFSFSSYDSALSESASLAFVGRYNSRAPPVAS